MHPVDGYPPCSICGRIKYYSSHRSRPTRRHLPPSPPPFAQSVEMCLLCGSSPKYIDRDGVQADFCGRTCRDTVHNSAPAIFNIPSWHKEFGEVNELFIREWKHPPSDRPRPRTLEKVYKVYSKKEHMRSFLRYKEATGNVKQRWHGTKRVCNMGNTSRETSFCSSPACSLCQILQQSFRVDKAGTNGSMFGKGIYTSATSSKAFGYAKTGSVCGRRAMLLCEVVMGKACIMSQANHSLTKPPQGYDSVVGDPDVTAGLNYDEVVVYKNEAIRPKYLVIF